MVMKNHVQYIRSMNQKRITNRPRREKIAFAKQNAINSHYINNESMLQNNHTKGNPPRQCHDERCVHFNIHMLLYARINHQVCEHV